MGRGRPDIIDVMLPLSILDLSPVPLGSTVSQALRNTIDLARHAEGWGYRRYWLAEHHSMPGIASAATAVVIGQVAAATASMRVGSGGIMLPNHSPLVVAEQFGTLEALFPGRIDLGVGRAPGADQLTARALRRDLATDPEAFPDDVRELLQYFAPAEPGRRILAVPGAGLHVPVWILGSSLFGAQVAAALGLPFAFASHFAPSALVQAIDIYRSRFRPSAELQSPYVMLGFNVFAAQSDAAARLLFTSLQQAFVNLRSGMPTQLPPPSPGYAESLPAAAKALLDGALACSAVGSADTVGAAMQAFVNATGADELLITSQIFDHAARLRSYEITAGLRTRLAHAA